MTLPKPSIKPHRRKCSGKRKDEQAHLAAVKALPCYACASRGINRQAEAHHVSEFGSVRSDYLTVPLCAEHHRGDDSIHGAKESFITRYGTIRARLAETAQLLHAGGNLSNTAMEVILNFLEG